MLSVTDENIIHVLYGALIAILSVFGAFLAYLWKDAMKRIQQLEITRQTVEQSDKNRAEIKQDIKELKEGMEYTLGRVLDRLDKLNDRIPIVQVNTNGPRN